MDIEKDKDKSGEPEPGLNLGSLEDLRSQIDNGTFSKENKNEERRGVTSGPADDKSQEELVDSILGMCDGFCISQGLTPINPAQKLLLRIGMIGTVKKYNLNLDEYPEITLIGGALWTIADKVSELKKIKADEAIIREAERRKHESTKGGPINAEKYFHKVSDADSTARVPGDTERATDGANQS